MMSGTDSAHDFLFVHTQRLERAALLLDVQMPGILGCCSNRRQYLVDSEFVNEVVDLRV